MRALFRMYGPVVVALAITYLLFRYVLPFVLPFVLAALLAIFIEPLVGFLQRRLRLGRTWAVGIVLTLGAIVTVALLFVGVASLLVELARLQDGIPELYAKAQETLRILVEDFGRWRAGLPAEAQSVIEEQQTQWLDQTRAWLELHTGRWLSTLQRIALVDVPNILIVLIVMAIATFMISKDREVVGRGALALIPPPWQDTVADVAGQLKTSIVGFVYAMALLVLATTLITILGLGLMGSPYALLLGILSGLLDIIPVLGPGLIFIPWILYSLLFGNVTFGLLLILLYGITVGLRTVLQAQLIGDRMGIHPLVALISIYIGARLIGPVGFILGPLVAVVLKVMVEARIISAER